MAENLFEPGKKSHCMFAPDLWCDYWKPTAEELAPFEFFCDVVPQTVLVVLPPPEGKRDPQWERVFSTIESVWQERGFQSLNADAGAWIEEKPCTACRLVRQAQVVILEYHGENPRATAFRDMALGSQTSLKMLGNFLPAPKKRVIVINSGPTSPPPHFRNVFDWIDYAGTDGKPDLALLRSRMKEIAQREEVFQPGGSMTRVPEEALVDDEIAKLIRIVEDRTSADPDIVRDSEGEFVMKVLGHEDVDPERPPAVPKRRAARTIDAPAPQDEVASVERARQLAKKRSYQAAFRELVAAARVEANEREVRDLERELIEAMPTRALAEVYFGGLVGRSRASHLKLEWKPGEPAEGELTVEGGDLEGLRSKVVVHVVDRLDEAAAETLRRRVRSQSEDGPVLIVIDHCSPSICGKFAELRQRRVFEIHVADLRRWALGRRPVTDALRERLRASYARAEDLFLRGLHDPVASEEKYVGRHRLLEHLRELLRSGDGFAIHGLSRAGKSSTLWRLASGGIKGHVIAVVDLHGHVPDHSAEVYVRTLRAIRDAVITTYPDKSRAWADVTKENRLFSLGPADSVDAFQSRFEPDIKALAGSVQRHIDRGFKRLDLLFDDVGSLASPAMQTLMTQVRGLVNHGSVAVGVCGPAFALQDELGEQSSPLQGLRDCFVSGLDDEDCGHMIRRIGHGMYAYFDDQAVAEVVQASGGHPLLVRYLCSVILERSSNGAAVIGVEAARHGIELALSMKNVRRWLDRTLQDMTEHLKRGVRLLQAIAQEGRRGSTIDRRTLEQVVHYEPDVIDQQLSRLRDYGLVPTTTGPLQLRVGLLDRWIQQREAEG